MGKIVFEVYPESPEAVTATGPSRLSISNQNAIKSGKYDQMPRVSYDITTASGSFEEGCWSASNYPILVQKTMYHTLPIPLFTLPSRSWQSIKR